ncbi:MAG TPA: ABC transporter ATP-binding protein [Acidimicrobiales bacterium]|nr:ABC transporter ATP-binding protein [Acidimicrobiales bacterium]
MIRVSNLTVAYGAVKALTDVSFEAPTGAITAVLGANGAGKTTLLRTLSGLKAPLAGSITRDDVELVGMRTENIARLGIAHVPEGRGVIGEFTVEENLRLGALNAKVSAKDSLATQYERFPILGERRRQHADQLSGGERQILSMARALIAQPTSLLLDEPSLGLAPLITAQIMATIKELCASDGLTVILVEQNASSALRIADRAIVLNVGHVVAYDSAAVVAADEKLRQYYLGMAV